MTDYVVGVILAVAISLLPIKVAPLVIQQVSSQKTLPHAVSVEGKEQVQLYEYQENGKTFLEVRVMYDGVNRGSLITIDPTARTVKIPTRPPVRWSISGR